MDAKLHASVRVQWESLQTICMPQMATRHATPPPNHFNRKNIRSHWFGKFFVLVHTQQIANNNVHDDDGTKRTYVYSPLPTPLATLQNSIDRVIFTSLFIFQCFVRLFFHCDSISCSLFSVHNQ